MTIWYIKIIHVVTSSTKVWMQKIREQTTTTTTTTFVSSSATSPAKIKTVKLAMTIIIVFVVCWTPYMVVTLIEIYSDHRLRIPSWFDGVLQTICLVQSSLNPFIYITFNHRRKAPPTIILASARTSSQKSRLRRRRNNSTSTCSIAETSFRTNGYNSSIIN
jgi:hypothetical protein